MADVDGSFQGLWYVDTLNILCFLALKTVSSFTLFLLNCQPFLQLLYILLIDFNESATKIQLDYSAALNNTTTASDCQTPSGQFLGDEPEQGIDGYRGKDFEKRKVLR